jgi:hypothetical protein
MANEVRPIDANALTEKLREAEAHKGMGAAIAGLLIRYIGKMPTIDPESLRPKGKWRLNKDGSGTCSECHRTRNDVWDMDTWDHFCSHCGADMREG